GDILLRGADALRYVRERKAFMGGDFERVANQQRFVSSMVDQVLTVDTLANPQKLTDVIDAIVPFITVDEGLNAGTIAGYGLQLNGIRSGDIHTFTVPHGPPTEGPGGASIVEQDEEGMDQLRRALQADDLASYLSGGDDDGTDGGEDTARPETPGSPSTTPTPSGSESSAGSPDPTTSGAPSGSVPESSGPPAPPNPCAGA
ncbi:MAG TPA: LCP family protein, partial [Citricoccus sp.]